MENCETESMDKAVRDEMMRLLRERVKDPRKVWYTPDKERPPSEQAIEHHAARLLTRAKYVDYDGCITISGMDYYRKETQPVRTWLRSNWFGVIVAGSTIVVSFFGLCVGSGAMRAIATLLKMSSNLYSSVRLKSV